jgi:hypothetical protein
MLSPVVDPTGWVEKSGSAAAGTGRRHSEKSLADNSLRLHEIVDLLAV